jgi:RHS repeat-associated protein
LRVAVVGLLCSLGVIRGGVVEPVAEALPAGLVARWLADNSASDSVGTANGSLVGSVTYSASRPGQGQAFNFNASGQAVNLGTAASINLTGSFSLSAWVNPSASFTGIGGLITKWDLTTANDSYGLYLSGGTGSSVLVGAVGVPSSQDPAVSGGVVPHGQWSHVATTYDAVTGQQVMYVNGVNVNSRVRPGGPTPSAIAVRLGSDLVSREYRGLLDDAQVYNVALSAADVQSVAGVSALSNLDQFAAGWAGDGTTSEVNGQANGIAIGPISYVPGVNVPGVGGGGQAFNFDGSSRVDVGNAAALALSGSLTIAAWVKPTATAEGQLSGVLSKWNQSTSGDAYGLYLLRSGGVTRPLGALGVASSSEAGFVVSKGSVPDDVWTHVAMTYDATTGINVLYVNGGVVGTRVRSGGTNVSGVSASIGSEGGGRYFKGAIDSPQLYGRALSAVEIGALGASGQVRPSILRNPNELLGGQRRGGESIADPVDPVSGNFSDAFVDISTPGGVADLTWSRTYNSRDVRAGSLMGPGYFTFVESTFSIDAATGNGAFVRGDGRLVTFPAISGGFAKPNDEQLTATAVVTGGWKVQSSDRSTLFFDANGRVSSLVSWNGQAVTVTRNGFGRPLSLADTTGKSVTLSYNAANLISQAASSDGRTVGYGYTNGVLTTVTGVDGGVTTMTVDTQNRITKIVDEASKVVVENVFDANGRVVSQKNGSGAETTFAYNDPARTTTITDAANGTVIVATYDASGRLVGMRDAANGQVTNSYDSRGNQTALTSRLGGQATATYDANDNPLTIVTPGVGATTRTFDTQNRILTETTPWGATTTHTYVGNERTPATITNALGQTTTVVASNGLITSVVDPDGVTSTYFYDANRRLVSSKDGLNRTTLFEYDTVGRPTKTTTPLGFVTTTTYDAAGRQLTTVAGDGGTTTNVWDTSGRLQSVTDPTNAVTSYTYDTFGRMATSVEPGGATTTYSYDAIGQLTKVTRPGGAEQTTVYGELGRVTSTKDPSNRQTSMGYDADGAVASVTAPDTGVSSTAYDSFGRVTSTTDQVGRTTSTTYDQYGRVASTTAPGAMTTSYTYDVLGRVSTMTDPRGGVTTTTYTAGGRQLSTTDPTGRVTTYAYDATGAISSITAPGGLVSSMGYDGDGRPITVTSPAGLVTTTGYDPVGRVISQTSPAGVVELTTYNLRGDVLTTKRGAESVVTYAWNPNGTLISVTDPLGRVTSVGYDARRNVTSRTNAAAGVDQWSYNLSNQMTSATDPLGRITTYGYDTAGRLSTVTDAAGRQSSIAFSPAGQPSTRTVLNGTNTVYGYDAAGRIASMTRGTDVWSYTYESGGQLASSTAPGGRVTSYTYDAAGRRTKMVAPDGSIIGYTYDSAGRLSSVNAVDLIADSFTAPSGSAPDTNKWTTTVAASGTATIQGNTLRMTLANVANSSVTLASKGVNATNVDISAAYTFSTTATRQNLRILGRYSTTGRYQLELRSDSSIATLTKTVGTTTTTLTTFSAPNQTTARNVRLQIDGTTIRARTWATTATEPTGWDATVTDTAVTPAGAVRLQAARSTGTGDVTVDDVTVSNPAAASDIAGFAYNADSQLTQETLVGGVRTWSYTNGRVTGLTSTIAGAPAAATLVYDSTGRLVTETVGATSTKYGYDAASQLCWSTTGVVPGAATCAAPPTGTGTNAWTYDTLGRRITARAGSTTTRYGYDAASQLCWSTTGTVTAPTCAAPPAGASTYSYDPSGRLTGHTVTATNKVTYGYNAEGQLATVNRTNGAIITQQTRAYDPSGKMWSVTTSTKTQTLDWSGGQLAAITSLNATATSTDTIIDGAGPWVAKRAGGTTSPIIVDAYASPVSTTATASVVRATSHDKWGVAAGTASFDMKLGYRGGLTTDALTRFGVRDYFAATSEFTTKDPLSGVNGTTVVADPYHYANNNPLNMWDPTGLRPGQAAVNDAEFRHELSGVSGLLAYLPSGSTISGYELTGNPQCSTNYSGATVTVWTSDGKCITWPPGPGEKTTGSAFLDGVADAGTEMFGAVVATVDPRTIPNDVQRARQSIQQNGIVDSALTVGDALILKPVTGTADSITCVLEAQDNRTMGRCATQATAGLLSLAATAKAASRRGPSPLPAPPRISLGKQGKHIVGHPNYIQGRSILTANPETLAKQAGSGQQVGSVPRGQPGFKERVDFGVTIGKFTDPSTKVTTDTTKGIIHYDGKGEIHIVPSSP